MGFASLSFSAYSFSSSTLSEKLGDKLLFEDIMSHDNFQEALFIQHSANQMLRRYDTCTSFLHKQILTTDCSLISKDKTAGAAGGIIGTVFMGLLA